MRSRRLTPRRRECARLEQNPARGRGHLEHLLPKPLKCNAWSSRCNALRRRSRWRTLLKGGAGLSAQRRPSAVSSWKHRQPIASLGNPANVLLSPASLSRHHVALAKPNLRFLQASSRRFCSSGSIPVASAASGVIDQNQRLFRPCLQTAKAPRYQVLVLCGGGLPRACQANSGPIYEGHAEECLRSEADNPKQRALMLKLASAWQEDSEALRRVAEGAPSDAPAPASLRRNKR